jgi:predicted dinucleotide-binding enzyme
MTTGDHIVFIVDDDERFREPVTELCRNSCWYCLNIGAL